jgi:hypothetical protein
MTEEEMADGFARFMKSMAAQCTKNQTRPATLMFLCRDSNGNIGFTGHGQKLSFVEELGMLEHAKLALFNAYAYRKTGPLEEPVKKTKKKVKK